MSTINVIFDRAAVVSGVERWTNYPVGSIYNTEASSMPDLPYLVCGARAFPESIKYKELSAAKLYVYVHNIPYDIHATAILLQSLYEPFVETDVSYDSLEIGGPTESLWIAPTNDWATINFPVLYPYDIRNAIKNGLMFELIGSIETPYGVNKPYFELTYGEDNVGVNIRQSYPAGSATISKSIPTTFSWVVSPKTTATLEPITAKNAVLRWRHQGASSYTEISCDTPTQCTIPADTFAEGTIQWQVVVTANSGIVTTSNWMTTAVKEPVSSAIALYPANTVLDGASEQTFAWEHIISNGTAQLAFELQTSPDGSSWTTIRHLETDKTGTTFAAGTFDAGDLWWRVRTYNLVGTAGDWSEAMHCIVIASPDAPSITADDISPRFVLRWQQSGQQAYELMVDGVVIAKTFSAESIYRHNGYLEPGTHTVRVRIQNKYQMWSDWGAAELQIKNVEGAAIQLSAAGKNEVGLNWSTSGDYIGYIVYRNETKIAETTDTSYIDHFAVGKAAYQVRGVYADSGYYTLSNVAAVNISPETLMIASVKDPVWVNLPLSTSSLRSASLSASQSVTYTHYIGSGLPGAEIGEAVSKSYNLECAFRVTNLDSIRQFESLLGKVVCIKTPSQRRIIGVMAQITGNENRFYATYRVPITEVKWEEMEI